MTDAAVFETPAVPGLLAALRAAAPTEGQADAALRTFLLAQSVGWPKARDLTEHATWYRHLRLLSDAGVSVPLRPYGDRRPAQGTDSQASTTFADVHALIGRSFTVTDAWDPQFYPDGTTGHAFALLFRDGEWLLNLAFDGSPGGTEHLPIREALHRCRFDKGGPDAG